MRLTVVDRLNGKDTQWEWVEYLIAETWGTEEDIGWTGRAAHGGESAERRKPQGTNLWGKLEDRRGLHRKRLESRAHTVHLIDGPSVQYNLIPLVYTFNNAKCEQDLEVQG